MNLGKNFLYNQLNIILKGQLSTGDSIFYLYVPWKKIDKMYQDYF